MLAKSLSYLTCLLAIFLTVAAARAQSTALQNGSSVTNEINAKESHLFDLSLEADQLVVLDVFAEELNFVLQLVGPDGNALEEFVHRRYGELTCQFVAPERGTYRLVLSSLEPNAKPRQYQLKVEQVRAATQREKEGARAAADLHRAEALRFKWESSSLAQASEKYRAASVAWQKQSQWASAAEARQRLGELHFIQGDYDKALRAFNEALRLSQRTDNPFLTITQLNNIGYVYIYLGDIKKAFSLFEQLQTQLSTIPDSQTPMRKRITAQLQNNFGEVEYARGNLKSSLNFFAEALALWREVDDRHGMALAHLNAGYSYLDSGAVQEAAAEFERALQLWREIKDWRGEALTLTAQGSLYALLGDKYTALTSHRTARDIFRRIGDRQGEAITSNGLGSVFEELNLKQEAIDNYSIALQVNQALRNKDFEALSNYYLGRVYRELGDFPQALKYYEACLALSRQSGKSRMATHALMDIAATYVKQQKFASALPLYEQSLAFYQQINDLRRQALTHQGLCELYHARGEPEPALRESRQGLELFQRIKDPQGEAESRYWLAKIAQKQGRLADALAESEKSINLIETQRTHVPTQNWRSTYFASVRRHYELYVDILMQLHQQQPERGFAALALQASEQARARSLLELLTETRGEIRYGVDPSLLARERQLRQQLSAKGAYQIQTLNTARPEAEAAKIELEIRQLNSEYDFVQAQIKAQSPVYAQLTRPQILTLAEIQAALKEDPGTVLLEYMLGDERSYVWLVSADTLVAQELPGRRVLETLAQEVYQDMTARQQRPGEEMSRYHERYLLAEEQFRPRATRLSQFLLGPLKTALETQRLLVVADGDLQYIPFDALPSHTSANDSQAGVAPQAYIPLLTEFEVIHLPSFSSLALLRQLDSSSSSSRRAQGIAIWADPVFESDDPRIAQDSATQERSSPSQKQSDASALETLAIKRLLRDTDLSLARLLGTQEEAESIMQFVPSGAAMLLTGFAANRESAVERNLEDYRILHFATHGLINDNYPSMSGLLLSTVDERGHSKNGLLQLHDIYGLRLNADLVVLSACQTGLGEELSGEGLVGLTQGFLYAGSKSVMVSLWKVDDKATATLMTNFYQAMLKEGDAPAVALRRAKLMMYQQGARQSPYYWSAFVIQGEYRSRLAPRRGLLQTRWLWMGAALSAIIFWVIYSRRKHRRNDTQPPERSPR